MSTPISPPRRGFLKSSLAAAAAAAAASLLSTSGAKAADPLQAPAGPEGLLLRGPDGRLHCIPDSKLEVFALSAAQRTALEKSVGAGLDTSTVTQLPMKVVKEAGVTDVIVNDKPVLFVNLATSRKSIASLMIASSHTKP